MSEATVLLLMPVLFIVVAVVFKVSDWRHDYRVRRDLNHWPRGYGPGVCPPSLSPRPSGSPSPKK